MEHTIIAFINIRSGSTAVSESVYRKLLRLLPKGHCYELVGTNVEEILLKFSHFHGLRLIVGGGDGSNSSFLREMSKVKFDHGPVGVALLPLGTGNELARVYGWGKSYGGGDLSEYVKCVNLAEPSPLDLWKIMISPASPAVDESNSLESAVCATPAKGTSCSSTSADVNEDQSRTSPVNAIVMSCFFSIGLDAYVSKQFHKFRENRPGVCNTRSMNKVVYTAFGIQSFFACRSLQDSANICLDGNDVNLAKGVEGVTFLNIPSTADGTNPWKQRRKLGGKKESPKIAKTNDHIHADERISGDKTSMDGWTLQSPADGRLEIVSYQGAVHLGGIQAGVVGGGRLGQASTAELKILKRDVPAQVDGEPVVLHAGDTIRIEQVGQAWILRAPSFYNSSYINGGK